LNNRKTFTIAFLISLAYFGLGTLDLYLGNSVETYLSEHLGVVGHIFMFFAKVLGKAVMNFGSIAVYIAQLFSTLFLTVVLYLFTMCYYHIIHSK